MTAALNRTHQLEQNSCIDLPGETVSCWSNKVRKIRVLLRKHRDVIFDISLDKAALYSVQSERDPFYDAMEKKLIPAGREVNFFDGSLKHFWVGRTFRGALLLKKNGKLVARYFPCDLGNPVGDDPRSKPAPLLVVMKNAEERPKDAYARVFDGADPNATERFTFVVQLDTNDASMPGELLEYFKHGGDQELFVSGNVATRNWTFNQIVAQLGFAHDNRNWMVEAWGQRLKFKKIKGTLSVVLTGNKRAREYLTANWYGARNAKVIAFSFGAGSARGLRHAAWGAVKGMVGKGGLATICFLIAIDVAEWLKEYEDRDPITGNPKRDWNDLFIKVGTDVAKAALGGVLTAVVGFAIGTLMIAVSATAAIPIAAIICGTIVLNLVVGFLIDFTDQRFGVSESIRKAVKPSLEKLQSDFGSDYHGFDNALGQALAYGSLGA